MASGLALALGQCQGWAGWLVLIALIPVLISIRASGFLASWGKLALCFSLYTVLSCMWIVRMAPGLKWVLLFGPVYAAAYLGLFAGAMTWAGRHLKEREFRLLILPAVWALGGLLGTRLFFRFNWLIVGQPLADYPLLAQAAAIGGPETLSFLAVLVNVLCFLWWFGTSRRAQRMGWATLAVLTGTVLLYGGWRLSSTAQPAGTTRVAVVQPMNPQGVLSPEARRGHLARMESLLHESLADNPAMAVLPEGALTPFVRFDDELTAFAKGFVKSSGRALLFGSADQEQGKLSNVAILITPFNVVTTYRKIHLVPFVEYQPQGFSVKRPKEWRDFTPGTERTVFNQGGRPRFSTMICVEDVFADLGRQFANRGAQVLVALIQTRTFLGTAESLQHLRRARLVSIAAGAPMVRAASSGVSCLVDAEGRVRERLPEGKAAQGVFSLAYHDARWTPYRILGDDGAMALFAALGGLTLLALKRLG